MRRTISEVLLFFVFIALMVMYFIFPIFRDNITLNGSRDLLYESIEVAGIFTGNILQVMKISYLVIMYLPWCLAIALIFYYFGLRILGKLLGIIGTLVNALLIGALLFINVISDEIKNAVGDVFNNNYSIQNIYAYIYLGVSLFGLIIIIAAKRYRDNN